MTPLRLAIFGAAGRMGRRLVALGTADPQFRLVAALDSPQHPQVGSDIGPIAGVPAVGVPLAGTLNTEADVMIDFSIPDGAMAAVEICLAKRIALVCATTGLDRRQSDRFREASQQVPVLWEPNMSLAVNLTMKLAEIAAAALKDKDADVEILERHHRFKEDSPSGTALKFGQQIAAAMGQKTHRHGREGRPGARPHDEIGYHAIRVGDNPGEHTIVFGMLGETMELTVRATNRDCYAQGALAAAKYLAGKPAGMYSIRDVLGL